MSNLKVNKVIEIAEVLNSYEAEESGFCGGLTGQALFFHFLNKIHPKKIYQEKRDSLILKILESFETEQFQGNICNGITGIAWFLDIMVKENVFTEVDEEFSTQINELIYAKTEEYLAAGNTDFLHGAFGIINYLLENNEQGKHDQVLLKVFNQLKKQVEKVNSKHITWKNSFNENDDYIALGISHGHPAGIAILNKFLKNNIEIEASKQMLRKAVNFIRSCQNGLTVNNKTTYFPHYYRKMNHKASFSRLAWCYGDMMIAHTLFHSACILDDKELKDYSIEVMINTAKRRDLAENMVDDACFCHGSSGVAYIFLKQYELTGVQELKDAADYWNQVTLNFLLEKKGIAGYLLNAGQDGMISEYGFLEGVTGVGFSLLANLAGRTFVAGKFLLID